MGRSRRAPPFLPLGPALRAPAPAHPARLDPADAAVRLARRGVRGAVTPDLGPNGKG